MTSHTVLLVQDIEVFEIVVVSGSYWDADELLPPCENDVGMMSYTLARGALEKTAGPEVDYWQLMLTANHYGDDRCPKGPMTIVCELCDYEDEATLDWTDYDAFMSHEDITRTMKAFLQAKEQNKSWQGSDTTDKDAMCLETDSTNS